MISTNICAYFVALSHTQEFEDEEDHDSFDGADGDSFDEADGDSFDEVDGPFKATHKAMKKTGEISRDTSWNCGTPGVTKTCCTNDNARDVVWAQCGRCGSGNREVDCAMVRLAAWLICYIFTCLHLNYFFVSSQFEDEADRDSFDESEDEEKE